MSRARILLEIGYTQAHHINVVPVPYKTVLMLKHCILIYNALISPCHRGQVDGRLYIRFEWDFIFSESLLELVNGYEIQIKYIVVKYPNGTSQNPS